LIFFHNSPLLRPTRPFVLCQGPELISPFFSPLFSALTFSVFSAAPPQMGARMSGMSPLVFGSLPTSSRMLTDSAHCANSLKTSLCLHGPSLRLPNLTPSRLLFFFAPYVTCDSGPPHIHLNSRIHFLDFWLPNAPALPSQSSARYCNPCEFAIPR